MTTTNSSPSLPVVNQMTPLQKEFLRSLEIMEEMLLDNLRMENDEPGSDLADYCNCLITHLGPYVEVLSLIRKTRG